MTTQITELQKKQLHTLQAVLTAQKLQHHLHELTVMKVVPHQLTNKVKNLTPDLLLLEKEFDRYDEHDTNVTTQAYDIIDTYIEMLVKLDYIYMYEIMGVINAYFKDKEPMLQLANEILNDNQ